MLKVLSYNIAWGKELIPASGWIMGRNPKPDIICLQEIPNRKIPSFKKLLDENGYAYKFAPSFTRKGITYGEITAYKKGAIGLVFSQVIDLGSSFIGKLIGRHNSKWRSLLTVLKSGKHTFIIINVHLLPHALNGKRRKQLSTAIEALKLLNFVNLPVLIVGDYNYSSLFGRGGLIKFMAQHGFTIGGKKRVITHKKWRIKHQTDYVFYRNCSAQRIRTVRLKHSDHYPVLFDLELK